MGWDKLKLQVFSSGGVIIDPATQQGLDSLGSKLDLQVIAQTGTNSRLDTGNTTLGTISSRVNTTNTNLTATNTKLDTVHTDLAGLDTKSGNANTKLDTLHTDLVGLDGRLLTANNGGDSRLAQLVLMLAKLTTIDTDVLQLVTLLTSISNRTPGSLVLDRFKMSDQLTGAEYLDDIPGNGQVKSGAFTVAPDLIWARSIGGISRLTLGGVVPTATKGIYCAADEPTPITCSGRLTVSAFIPTGTTLSLWAFRYT